MKTRGVIQIWLLYVLGAALLSQAVPNWRLTNLFAKGPQTDQLRAAEDAAAKAKLDAQQAEAHYNSALADFQAKKGALLSDSQQYLAGVKPALLRAPQSPEVILAASLADRAAKGLSQAIGDLSADKQAEIMAIVDGALSAKQAQVDAAMAALAKKDAELAATVQAKNAVEAQLPLLAATVKAADAKAEAVQGVVAAKTAEVAAYADKAAAKEKENGSLGATMGKLLWAVGFIAAIILFFNFLLPLMAAEFPACGWLVTLNKIGRSLTSAHP